MSSKKDSSIITIEEYSEDEFKQLTWEQYGAILDRLYQQVSEYSSKHNIQFDAVVPILRGGMIPASYLCGKLKILQVIPVQFKYFITDNNVTLKRLLPLAGNIDLGTNPHILVVENCFCFGETTKAAVRDVRKQYPTAKIYVAADRIDYLHKELNDVEAVFWGDLDNDTKKLSSEECLRLGIDATQFYYPWETIDEEIAASTLKQYDYQDVNQAKERGEDTVHFDLTKGTIEYT